MGVWKPVALLVVVLVITLVARQWLMQTAAETDTQTAEDSGLAAPASPGEEAASRTDAGNATGAQLPAGVTQEQYDRAARMYQTLYPGQSAGRLDVISLAAEMALNEEQLEEAVIWFGELPTEHPFYGKAARAQEADALISLNRFDEAEASLQTYWSAMRGSDTINLPRVIDAFKRWEYILSAEIRLEERAGLLRQIHEVGLADIRDSKHYFFPNLLLLNSSAGRERIDQVLQADPDSKHVRLAHARYRTLAGEFDEAVELLQTFLRAEPGNVRALTYLLEAYFEAGEMDDFAKLAAQLPEYAEEEPWLLTQLRGEYAVEDERFEDAVKFFQTVLEKDPANPIAQMGLANSYGKLGQPEKQQQAIQRSSVLAEIRVSLSSVQSDAIKALDELVVKCREINFEPAAQMFEIHAQALREQVQQQGGQLPSEPDALLLQPSVANP